MFAFSDAPSADRLAENQLVAAIMPSRIEEESGCRAASASSRKRTIPGAGRASQSPAREDAGEFGYIVLRVAAINPERAQLQELACVVLVETLKLPPLAGSARAGVLPVVEVEQHRRMGGRCLKKRSKAAQNVGTDGVLLVMPDPKPHEALAGKDIEVVEPEGGHHLVQLPGTPKRAD
jgi:hypothetical protein